MTTAPRPLLLLVLLALVAPAAAQQFDPAAVLPGDDTIAASAGNQGRPSVAIGGGATLAVWEDDRSSRIETVEGGQALGGSVPGNIDVYGVLLDAAGQPATTAPIAIAAETWDQTNPRVASNGGVFLVVFESVRPTTHYRSGGIYAVRVAANGAVLDPVPFAIDDDPDVDELAPAVAAVGGRWLVTWSDFDNSGLTVIRGRFVDAGGVVGAPTTWITGTPGQPPTQVALAGVGNRVAITWSAGYGNGILAEVRDGNGVRIGNRLALATTGGKPAVGASANGFYVAWQGIGYFGTPIDFQAVAAQPGGAVLASTVATLAPALAVAHDGNDWIVAYPETPDVFAVRVGATGVVGATITVATAPVTVPLAVSDIAIVGSGGGATVLWTDRRLGLDNIDSADVFSARVTANATTAAVPVSVSVPAQVNVRCAEVSYVGYLLVYESQTSGTTRIMTRLVDANGTALLPQPFEVAVGDRKIGGAAVAWNGNEHLVTWGRLQSTSTSGPPSLIEARRCDLVGAPIDAAPFTVMEGHGPTVAALGSTFLVAALFRHLVLQYQPVMRCRRVDGTTGALLDPSPRIIQAGAAGGPWVVAFADRWLVVFGPGIGAFVLADGTPQPLFPAAAIGHGEPHMHLCLDAARTGALLTFEHRLFGVAFADVHIRRLAGDGSSTDPIDGLLIAGGRHSQLRPVSAALDDGYLCLWTDHRDSLEIEPGIGDVFAAPVSLAGIPIGLASSPVHDTAVAEGGGATVRTGRGTALVAASRVVPAFGAHRLQLTRYRSPGDDRWASYGTGLAGNAGEPQLSGFGSLVAGEPFDLTLTNARPNALAVTGAGIQSAATPLLGGTLLLQPLLVVDAFTNGTGQLRLGTLLPPGLTGAHLFFQTWVLDPTAPQGAAATAGLRGIPR